MTTTTGTTGELVPAAAPPPANNVQPRAQQSGPDMAAVERVVMTGDLSRLTPEERWLYIRQLCSALNLNPLTQPLIYLTDRKGKLVVYPTKDCAAQIRKRDNVSQEIVSREVVNDVLIVRVRAFIPGAKGHAKRSHEDEGAVSVRGLTGEDFANAVMKAGTKAARRAVLALGGLGFLDPEESVEAAVDAQPPLAVIEQPSAGLPSAAAQQISYQSPPASAATLQPTTTQPNADTSHGRLSTEQLNDLTRLKQELNIDTATWRSTILAKRGVQTARELTPAQAEELIGKLKHRLMVSQLEPQQPGAQPTAAGLEVTLPPNRSAEHNQGQEAGAGNAAAPGGFR